MILSAHIVLMKFMSLIFLRHHHLLKLLCDFTFANQRHLWIVLPLFLWKIGETKCFFISVFIVHISYLCPLQNYSVELFSLLLFLQNLCTLPGCWFSVCAVCVILMLSYSVACLLSFYWIFQTYPRFKSFSVVQTYISCW